MKGFLGVNLILNRADNGPILGQPTASHVESDDSSRLCHCQGLVGEPQRAVIAADPQLHAAAIWPKQSSTCYVR